MTSPRLSARSAWPPGRHRSKPFTGPFRLLSEDARHACCVPREPAEHGSSCSAKTEQSTWERTRSAVLPIRNHLMPVRQAECITMNSISTSSASARITLAGLPAGRCARLAISKAHVAQQTPARQSHVEPHRQKRWFTIKELGETTVWVPVEITEHFNIDAGWILVVQDHAEEATLHDQPAVAAVIDKAKLPELIHEVTYP